MELSKYPSTAPVPMPDESAARQSATALLVLEGILLGLALPIQALMFLSLGWEGGDEALKQRMALALPLLGLGGLLAAVLSGVAASVAWRGSLVDPLFGPVWVVMTASAPLALALLLVVRRRVRRAVGSS